MKRTDLRVALRAMHYLLLEKLPFLKYGGLMDLLENFEVTTRREDRPGNAQLSSERFKDEVISVLGEKRENVATIFCD